MARLLESRSRSFLLIAAILLFQNYANAKETSLPWIPEYESNSSSASLLSLISTNDLKKLEDRQGDYGRIGERYIYLPKSQEIQVSKDTSDLFQVLFAANKKAYACVVEPLRVLSVHELTETRKSNSWRELMKAVLYVYYKCQDNPQFYGKWVYEPISRIKKVSPWKFVWVIHQKDFSLFSPQENFYVLSDQIFKLANSDATLASIIEYAALIAKENKQQLSFKDIDKKLSLGEFKKALLGMEPNVVAINSLDVKRIKHSLYDIEITENLVKRNFHPGAWYSVLKKVLYLYQNGFQNVDPFRSQLGNVVFRSSNLSRYLDRKNYVKTGKVVNEDLFQNDLRQAGFAASPGPKFEELTSSSESSGSAKKASSEETP